MQKKYEDLAPALTRWAIALVFLWFGINQIIDPQNFMGYLPQKLLALDYAQSLVMANGIIESILGLLLLLGLVIRITAFILLLHLLFIIASLGYNDIAVRDAGLALVTLAILIGGKDKWSLDYKKR